MFRISKPSFGLVTFARASLRIKFEEKWCAHHAKTQTDARSKGDNRHFQLAALPSVDRFPNRLSVPHTPMNRNFLR